MFPLFTIFLSLFIHFIFLSFLLPFFLLLILLTFFIFRLVIFLLLPFHFLFFLFFKQAICFPIRFFLDTLLSSSSCLLFLHIVYSSIHLSHLNFSLPFLNSQYTIDFFLVPPSAMFIFCLIPYWFAQFICFRSLSFLFLPAIGCSAISIT